MRDILRDYPVILPILRLLTSCIILWGFTIIVMEKLKKPKNHGDIETANKKTLDKTQKAYILVTIGFVLQLVIGIIGILISI